MSLTNANEEGLDKARTTKDLQKVDGGWHHLKKKLDVPKQVPYWVNIAQERGILCGFASQDVSFN